MAKTFTKKEMYAAAILFINSPDAVVDGITRAEVTERLEYEIGLLDKRANTPRKPSKVQIENEQLKASILEYLATADRPQTIKEIQAAIPELENASNQKITHLLTPLVNDGILVKIYEKKVPHFTLAQ